MFKINNKDTSTASVILFGHFYHWFGKKFLQSVTKSNFRKCSGLNSAQMMEFVTESVFSRASGLYYNRQCESLWRSLFLDSGVNGSIFN